MVLNISEHTLSVNQNGMNFLCLSTLNSTHNVFTCILSSFINLKGWVGMMKGK